MAAQQPHYQHANQATGQQSRHRGADQGDDQTHGGSTQSVKNGLSQNDPQYEEYNMERYLTEEERHEKIAQGLLSGISYAQNGGQGTNGAGRN
ncbi:hypothetical protein BT63DRAFT_419763 [Microthyrium microscopicum]|uniref:Uncharacterized protein n=1 Tax=Microthyrium microscopicum TaxID=703497 RepID=A0A6A6UST5_9PEZI|nr:hypothetical protein BT63DRAFT_419763 [Microthyrium microscopicum]